MTGSDEGLVRRWAHVLGFHPSPRRVVAAQWELPMDLTLQGSAYGGFGYAAASTTLHVVDQHDYH